MISRRHLAAGAAISVIPVSNRVKADVAAPHTSDMLHIRWDSRVVYPGGTPRYGRMFLVEDGTTLGGPGFCDAMLVSGRLPIEDASSQTGLCELTPGVVEGMPANSRHCGLRCHIGFNSFTAVLGRIDIRSAALFPVPEVGLLLRSLTRTTEALPLGVSYL